MNTTPANEQPENENAPSQTPEKKTIEQQLEEEMKKWQTKIDEVKVQLNLAAMDAKDKAQPHIDQLEQEMAKAEKEWQEFKQASGGACQDLSKGLRLSFKAIQHSADKAKEHFEPKKD